MSTAILLVASGLLLLVTLGVALYFLLQPSNDGFIDIKGNLANLIIHGNIPLVPVIIPPGYLEPLTPPVKPQTKRYPVNFIIVDAFTNTGSFINVAVDCNIASTLIGKPARLVINAIRNMNGPPIGPQLMSIFGGNGDIIEIVSKSASSCMLKISNDKLNNIQTPTGPASGVVDGYLLV